MEELGVAFGILLSVFSAALFSAIEFSIREFNKIQPEGTLNLAERTIQFFQKNPHWMAGTLRVGKIISQVSFLYFFAQLLAMIWILFSPDFKGKLFYMIMLIVLTVTVLLVVDVLAKYLMKKSTSQLIYSLIVPFGIFFIIMFPLVYPFVTIAKFIGRVGGTSSEDLIPILFSPEVNANIKNKEHIKSESELELDKKIFQNALRFKNVKVRDCMIPRTEIVAVDQTVGLEKLREVFVESGHSKIIVFKTTIDDVIGYCHSAALFKKPSSLNEILTPIISVPENTLANDLMIRFISERKSLGVVIDEFGGTSGIVSMEDVIEEIFGDIEDEHDEDNLVEQKLNELTYLFSARLEIDYLNEAYKLELPTGDYDTLGGLILSFTEDLPEVGKIISSPPFTFTVQSTLESRIDTIKINLEKAPGEG